MPAVHPPVHDIGEKKADGEHFNTAVLAVSSAAPSANATGLKAFGNVPLRLLSEDSFANARRFHTFDYFEAMELHSTILIDRKGHVHWARNGGEPVSDAAFPVKQLERMNQ